ncbi:precorrin-3B C(17)-methyltransferase [Acuticoccus mangrovi]|uniref:Precorrin-3B C(17)-methyltransferase n=1 Tax=Acuticoccus mangrovi TaxID=2796142 RepID=A0A934MMJ4_9HYPH|nr:precorrin-3B C(17)-methyltransferase [Acuticoccus mangrovi]MBJ3777314.1 precorrin-3B C(17)-methyltransferase [Acuticoccus mangrovi]
MTLTIVGVGPGDPELLTLKAVRILAAADVVAYPVSSQGSFAARIAAAHIGAAEHFAFAIPMSGDGAAEAAYDAAAETIAGHLSAGRTVALLCEGDPMLYGSAASVMARLAGRFAVDVVPGVTAASACAAVSGTSMVRYSEPLTILPATASAERLRASLAADGALVIYKIGRHFDAVKALIRAAGRDGTLIARATLPEQEITPLNDAPPGPKPYFSTVLVPAASSDMSSRPAVDVDAPVAVVVLGPSALATARAAKATLAAAGIDARLHGLVARVEAEAVDVPFAAARHHIGHLFATGHTVVGVMSAGILIRAVAPYLADKPAEPALLALAEDGSAVVPLLGAHRGGGRIATLLGETFGVAPAATTQGEVRLGVALDDPPAGWRVADPRPFKRLAADLAAGGGAAPDPSLDFLASLPAGAAPIRSTIHPAADADIVPTYVARRVALGMGAERHADPAAAVDFARAALDAAAIDPRAVAVVVSLDKKADEAALAAVAADLGAPLRVFDAATLAAQEPRLATPSETVRAAVGVAGVAEAAALAAAGPDGALIMPKRVEGALTLALAAAVRPITPTVGRARGRLRVVGIGPGTARWRTLECLDALARADAFVGYTLYLDLVEDLRGSQSRHDFALGEETARVRYALELAGTGRDVALISSGDPGIYAMATLAMELLDTGNLSEGARRVAVEVVPGISAAQAAAARLGAPLGHDFAFVSLSDLMTPWEAIRRRLEAAAVGDFVVALYNPRSRRRTSQLTEALEIFRAHRPAATPVVVAASLGRPAEALHHTTLGALDAERVDMLATVLVGASTTHRFTRGDGRIHVYTPRGYEVHP